MARGRKRADEILAFDPARRHVPRRSRRHGQIALAHRARLRGTEKRARPRPFRRAKLARIPSSRRPLHRRLRFSHPRTSGDSPLRPPAAPNVSPILASQTQRRRQSDPNGMSKIRSRRSEGNSRSRWPEASCAARVAKLCHHDDPIGDHRDTVELEGCPVMSRVTCPALSGVLAGISGNPQNALPVVHRGHDVHCIEGPVDSATKGLPLLDGEPSHVFARFGLLCGPGVVTRAHRLFRRGTDNWAVRRGLARIPASAMAKPIVLMSNLSLAGIFGALFGFVGAAAPASTSSTTHDVIGSPSWSGPSRRPRAAK